MALSGVAMTAVGVALIRERESARPDRLYHDPLAAAFVAAARDSYDAPQWEQVCTVADQFYDGRTVAVRLFDDRVRAAVDAGIRQLVLLGAGLDSRAFRMELPMGTMIFELDLPEVFEFKEPVLAAAGAVARCGREIVPADLRGDWPAELLAQGFEPAQPAYWVDEGTLGFLTQEWSQAVVAALTGLSAPGSRFDANRLVTDPQDEALQRLGRLVRADGAQDSQRPDSGGGSDFDVAGWLGDLGWHTEFRSWNDAVAPLRPAAALANTGAGSILATRVR